MAMRGLLPVVEIMFGDFLALCMDQILNHATKFHAMYDGKVPVSSVIRTAVGAGRGYGPTHSQSLEKLLLGIPHLRVIAPSHAHDPGALLLHAITRDAGVVLFIEHKLLYPAPLLRQGGWLSLEEVQERDGYPTVLIKNFAQGRPDVTLIAYGGMSRICAPVLEALAPEEIRILAVFPSSLKPLPIETLANAAAQSGRVVIAEEGTSGFNWGSEVSAVLYERCWRRLETPIRRLATYDSILPAARPMEEQVIVTPDKLQAAILETLS
jgi:pyruvate/2-oxoglutarate/acetoin dehydrogenase E1 component